MIEKFRTVTQLQEGGGHLELHLTASLLETMLGAYGVQVTSKKLLVSIAAICVLSARPMLLPQTASSENPYPFRAADPGASPRIAKLRGDLQDRGAAAVLDFWQERSRSGAPIIEPIPGDDQHSLVTFVWQGSAEAKNVVVVDGVALGVGDVDPANSRMMRIDGTDVWYRTYDVRNDARFTYALSENDPLTSFVAPDRKSNSKPDPLNPNRFLTGQTYVELSSAPPQPWITPLPPEMSGTVDATKLNGHAVWVYKPRGFQPAGARYPLVILMGGGPYMNFVSVPAVLDNLISQKRIPPVIAAVVGSTSVELMCSPAYADFLAKDLVPWLRKNYHATDKPAETVIGGSSLGGLASTFTAVTHPEVFGKVLSQSASYWWKPDSETEGEWLRRQIAAMPRKPVEFFLEVGRMEAREAQLDTNRRMRDTLIAKDYPVRYQEFNGNHTYIHWRGSLGDGLIVLLSR
jgi:enterochelin esterase family protein